MKSKIASPVRLSGSGHEHKKNKLQIVSKNLILILIALLTLLSCSKDDSKPEPIAYQEENPMQGIIETTGFNQISNQLDNLNTEFGFSFKPTVTGKINAFVVKIPASSNNVRVTFWDVETKSVIRTEFIAVITANTVTTKVISPINLVKNKEYLLSINCNHWYDYFEPNDAVAAYPLTVGNIVFTNCSYMVTPNQIFPSSSLDTQIFGNISFNFQRTE